MTNVADEVAIMVKIQLKTFKYLYCWCNCSFVVTKKKLQLVNRKLKIEVRVNASLVVRPRVCFIVSWDRLGMETDMYGNDGWMQRWRCSNTLATASSLLRSSQWNVGCLKTRYHSNAQVSVGNMVECVKVCGKWIVSWSWRIISLILEEEMLTTSVKCDASSGSRWRPHVQCTKREGVIQHSRTHRCRRAHVGYRPWI